MIIYKATNKINGKIYIGQTCSSIKIRIGEHRRASKLKKENSKFYNAIRKYGINNFVFELVEKCKTKEELNNKEVFYISLYDSYKLGYNSTLGGDGVSGGEHHPLFGKKRPEFSESISGEKHPNFGNIGELSPRYGQKHTEETKRKITKSLIGNKRGVDNTLYEFEHLKYGKIIATKYEMKKKYNLEGKCIALLCRGERNTHKGWKMVRCVSGTDSQLKQKRVEALPLGKSMKLEAPYPLGSE